MRCVGGDEINDHMLLNGHLAHVNTAFPPNESLLMSIHAWCVLVCVCVLDRYGDRDVECG